MKKTLKSNADNPWLTLLKEVGLKVTDSRLEILHIFSVDCHPINAEYIYSKLKNKHINQVTVYRTLFSLEKARIIKKIDLRKDSAYYELADKSPERHHHHLVCTDCGCTESFEICQIENISKEVLKKSSLFKAVSEHSLELFGLCKSCSKE